MGKNPVPRTDRLVGSVEIDLVALLRSGGAKVSAPLKRFGKNRGIVVL